MSHARLGKDYFRKLFTIQGLRREKDKFKKFTFHFPEWTLTGAMTVLSAVGVAGLYTYVRNNDKITEHYRDYTVKGFCVYRKDEPTFDPDAHKKFTLK